MDGERDEPAGGDDTSGETPGATSTVELLRRAQSGDDHALDALLRRYAPLLKRWATGRLPAWARDLIDTDDLVQETLINTLRHVESFQPVAGGAFHAYVRQALRNRIRDELRRARRRPAAVTIPDSAEVAEPSPLEAAIGRESVERYERALERLDAADREAIVARVELGLPYGEIAQALGKTSSDAARMAVGRALVRLAREMGHGTKT